MSQPTYSVEELQQQLNAANQKHARLTQEEVELNKHLKQIRREQEVLRGWGNSGTIPALQMQLAHAIQWEADGSLACVSASGHALVIEKVTEKTFTYRQRGDNGRSYTAKKKPGEIFLYGLTLDAALSAYEAWRLRKAS